MRGPRGLVFGAEELVDARLEGAVFVGLAVHEAFGADLGALDPVGEFVKLFACVGRAAGGHDAQDGFCRVKNSKAFALRHRCKVHKLHVETDIRLVAAVAAHRLIVVHARECFHLHVEDHFEQVTDHAFEGVQDVFLFHEGHFTINLRELGLPVRTKVLVAEAFHDLIVAVKPAHHQQLLERLGALRQCVKLSGVHAAGDHKVAGALRRGLDEVRRLHIDEAHRVEVLPGFNPDAVPQEEVVLNGLPAQIEVAVLHPQIVPAIGVIFDGEGRRFRGIQDGK